MADTTTPREPTPAPAGETWETILTSWEREALALGKDPAAAKLFHAMGHVWEDHLHHPKNAAMSYQNAYASNPRYRPTLAAARRLFTEAGQHDEVLALFERELDATPDAAGKAELLRARAALLETLGREADAGAALEAALKLAPDHPGLLEAELAVALRAKDLARAASLHERLGESLRDGTQKALHIGAAAALRDKLGDAPAAKALRIKLASVSPRDPEAQLLAPALKADGNKQLLAKLLDADAESTSAASAHLELGQLLGELGDLETEKGAYEQLSDARELAPRDGAVLLSVIEAYSALGRHAEVEKTWKARAESARTAEDRAIAHLALSDLYAGPLANKDSAVASAREALAAQPGWALAEAALEKLGVKLDDPAARAAAADANAASAADGAAKATALVEAARLHEQLGDAAASMDRWTQAAAADPANPHAARAARRYAGEAGLVDAAAQATGAAKVRALLSLAAQKGNDPAAQLALYQEAAAVTPQPPAGPIALAQATAAQGDFAGHAAALEQIGHALSGADAAEAFADAGDVAHYALKDPARALALHRKALAAHPDFAPSYAYVANTSQGASEGDAAAGLRKQAEGAEPAQAAALLYRAGALTEAKGDLDAALGDYTDAAGAGPHLGALRALERIARAKGDLQAVAQNLASLAAATGDAILKAEAFTRAAMVEQAQGRVGEAGTLFEQAVAAFPRSLTAWRLLARLRAESGQFAAAAAAYEKLAGNVQLGTRIEALRRAAHLHLDRLDQPDKAATHLRAILEETPGDVEAQASLARAAAALGDHRTVAEVRAKLATKCTDQRMAAAMRAQAGAERLAAGEIDLGVAEYRRALALNPKDRVALDAVDRALRGGGNAEALVTHWGLVGAYADMELRAALAIARGEILELLLKNPDAALAAYREALSADSSLLGAIQGARRVLISRLAAADTGDASGERADGGAGPAPSTDDFNEVRKLWALEGEAMKDPAASVKALVEAGRIAEEKLDDPEQAITHYAAALERNPSDASAGERLKVLFTASNRQADLVALYERFGSVLADERAASAWITAARIRLEDLSDYRGAFIAAGRALAKDPASAGALELRARTAELLERWQDAADALAKRLALSAELEPSRRARLQLTQGLLLSEKLNDTAKAAPLVRAGLADAPNEPDLLERAAQALERAGDADGTVVAYRRLLEQDVERARLSRYARALARAFEKQGDEPSAGATWRRCLELDPGDELAMEALAQHAERVGDAASLGGVFDQYAGRVSPAEKERAAPLRLKAARAHAAAGARDRAIASLKAALEADPASVAARVELADIYASAPETAMLAAEEHLALLRTEPLRSESYRALVKLYAANAQPDRAFVAAAVAVGLKVAGPEEQALHAANAPKLPTELPEALAPEQLDLLQHPGDRGVTRELLAAVAPELAKVFPVDLTGKANRVKGDNPVKRVCDQLAKLLGADEYQLYAAMGDPRLVTAEQLEPPALVIGGEVPKHYAPREQRFLFARALARMRLRTVAFARMQPVDLASLIAALVRLKEPTFSRFGQADAGVDQRLAKHASKKARAAIDEHASKFMRGPVPDFEALLRAMRMSAERLGALACGDPAMALGLVLAEGAAGTPTHERPEVTELAAFLLGDEHAAMRARLKIGLAA